MKIGIGLLMVLWVGCFAGRDRVGSDREALRSEVEFVEDLPKTISGKIRRNELHQRELDRKA